LRPVAITIGRCLDWETTLWTKVEAGIGIILGGPAVWRVIEDDFRRYLIERFPYGIYYTIEEDVSVIWAVKHLHRDLDYWQQRRR